MSRIRTKYITDNAITNDKLADMAGHTYKGNNTASSSDPVDVTATQLTADLDTFTSSLQGVVPGSGGGTINFLRADGTWDVPVAAPSPYGPAWTKYTVSHAALQTAATTNNITLYTAAANTMIHQVLIKQSTAFAGTSITAYTVSIGITGDLTKFATDYDVFQVVSDTARSITQVNDIPSFSGTTLIKIQATSTGANLSASTAGSVDVWVLASLLP